MSLKMRKGLTALMAVAAVILGACGGGGSDTELASAPAPTEAQQVKSRAQPVDAVQDVSPIRQRLLDSGSLPKASRVALGPLLQTKTVSPDNRGAFEIGVARSVEATATAAGTNRQFQWKSTPSGGFVGAISFDAEGAKGLRLGVLVRQLPGSAILRVYSQSQSGLVYQVAGQEVLRTIDANLNAGDSTDNARTWWTPDLGFSEITLEVELPAGIAVETLDVAVPSLSHIFADIQSLAQDSGVLEAGESNSCNLDVSCYVDLPNDRNAVARMSYVKNGGSYLCTGTLLNDSKGSGKPYFLSANHCISNQTVASTLQTDWLYRSSSCNRLTVMSASTKRYGGATLLYASGASDTSFMLLKDTPPAGTWFAGWSSVDVPDGTVVLGLHHPKGDLMKISGGLTSGAYSCELSEVDTNFRCEPTAKGSYSRVQTVLGITEGGSSGSALFREGYVVGTLTGGSSMCAAGKFSGYDYYGSFGVAYRAALNVWLWPNDEVGASGRSAIYRFYNTATGAHFFTSSAAERNSVITNLKTFNYEGVAFYAYGTQGTDLSPVFRFYNPKTASHFFTISAAERDWVKQTYPFFQFEGPAWYAQTAASNGATAMYRFYLPKTGTHFYTISAAERDYVIQSLKDYQYEGPGYFGWTTQ